MKCFQPLFGCIVIISKKQQWRHVSMRQPKCPAGAAFGRRHEVSRRRSIIILLNRRKASKRIHFSILFQVVVHLRPRCIQVLNCIPVSQNYPRQSGLQEPAKCTRSCAWGRTSVSSSRLKRSWYKNRGILSFWHRDRRLPLSELWGLSWKWQFCFLSSWIWWLKNLCCQILQPQQKNNKKKEVLERRRFPSFCLKL